MSCPPNCGDESKDYCKKYFPECNASGPISIARLEACRKLGGTINACGCCMCRKWPGETQTDGGNGGSFKCVTCSNPGKFRCSGTSCPTGYCGKGRFCGPDGCGTCKPGCRCVQGRNTLCPLVREM